MVTININNKKYEIPERLTIAQYQKAIQFDWEDPKYYPMIVSQLIDAPLYLLNKAPQESMVLAIALVVQAMNQRTKVDTLELDKIRFGEFIDLDVYLTLGIEQHFEDIAKILCPKAKWADEVMWAIDRFASFRTHTYRQYKILFGLTDSDLESTEIDDREPKDKLASARGWYRIIVSLAGEDILKMDAVTEQPLTAALNFMALQKEKIMEENEQKLKQKRQYDLSRSRH